MLSRQNRLKTKDYSIKEKGEVLHSPLFRIQIIHLVISSTAHQKELVKIGVTISKKVLKLATDRNKLKRKICYACNEIGILKIKNTENMGLNIYIQYINKTKAKKEKLPTYKNIKQNLQETLRQILKTKNL